MTRPICNDASLEAHIKALEVALQAFHDLMDERDRRYEVQFDSVGTNIDSVKEAVGVAIASADKAVTKAEQATKERFEAGNEIRQAMLDREKSFANASESKMRFDAIDKKLDELGGFRSVAVGRGSAIADVWSRMVAAALVGAALASVAINFLK